MFLRTRAHTHKVAAQSCVSIMYIMSHWNQKKDQDKNYYGKVFPVAGRGGPQGCEMSRLPYFLDNKLTDGDEAVSLMRWWNFISRRFPGTHFC
jgi:hypothetical protein